MEERMEGKMEIDALALKSKGFFQQAEKNKFSLRICASGGAVTTGYLKKAMEIADAYGEGQIHLTTRQQIEIPHIPAENLEATQRMLADFGIRTFTGGARVRTVVACQGSRVCKFGQIETGDLAREIQDAYYGRELPAKLKIAVTGCKNNCAKVEANDVGIRGSAKGYLLYFGGCFGRTIRVGEPCLPELKEKDQVLAVLDRAVGFFETHAAKGERLGKLLDRVGMDAFKAAIAGDLA
jgi:dissimilatory sulfite reductase (desulfoviridin) alpha/beta subunit